MSFDHNRKSSGYCGKRDLGKPSKLKARITDGSEKYLALYPVHLQTIYSYFSKRNGQ